MQHVQPSIRLALTTAESDDMIALGTMKFGGLPDLPPELSWPSVDDIALHFIAQLRMDVLAANDPTGLLPKSGMLYFFYRDNLDGSSSDGCYWDLWRAKVLYFDGDMNALQQASAPDSLPMNLVFPACTVTVGQDLTIPPFESQVGYTQFGFSYEALKQDRNRFASYFALREAASELLVHRMFGYPDLIQGDVFIEADKFVRSPEKIHYKTRYADTSFEDWLLLLQVDSDDAADFMWGDVGCLYYCIKRADLLAKNFEKIVCTMQCC